MNPFKILAAALALAVLAAATPVSCAGRPGAADAAHQEHRHGSALDWARRLLHGLRLSHTSYRHTTGPVHWQGVDGAKFSESHTDCSGFLNALLARAYGYTEASFRQRLGSKRPLARHYHDAIAKQNRFHRIMKLQDVRPGDVIAIRYAAGDPENKDNNTGHVLLVTTAPRPRRATAPTAPGTEQWEVGVIDQSRSGHGPTDTRRVAKGKFHPGLGEGVLRLYTHRSGQVAGYSWSTLAGSTFHDQGARHLVIGRLTIR